MTWSPPDARPSTGSSVVPAVGTAPAGRRPLLGDLLAGVATTALTVLLGAPLGLLWSAVAPHSHALVEAGGAYISDAETEVFIAGDGWFFGLTLLVGIATGVVAWFVARRSGPFVVVGLFVGGLLASYVASRVGLRVGQDALAAAVHSGRPGTYTSNIALQTKTALVAWPLGALAAFGTLVASRVDEIR